MFVSRAGNGKPDIERLIEFIFTHSYPDELQEVEPFGVPRPTAKFAKKKEQTFSNRFVMQIAGHMSLASHAVTADTALFSIH